MVARGILSLLDLSSGESTLSAPGRSAELNNRTQIQDALPLVYLCSCETFHLIGATLLHVAITEEPFE